MLNPLSLQMLRPGTPFIPAPPVPADEPEQEPAQAPTLGRIIDVYA